MKKFVIALMAVMLVAGLAVADKPVVDKPIQAYAPNGRAAEAEPNDDFTTANALVVGDDMSAAIDPAGDVDYFAFEATAGMIVSFETMPGDVNDTKMYLYDTDGTTELAFNDDIGYPNYYSMIEFTFPADGTYFIAITGYSGTTTGTYILTASAVEPPAPGETCDTALVIEDLAPVNTISCPGADDHFFYTFTAGIDGVLILDTCIPDQEVDTLVYILDECDGLTLDTSDDDGDCDYSLASYLEFAMTAGQSIVIEFDGSYSNAPFDFTISYTDGVVATTQTSFDSLKSMYR